MQFLLAIPITCAAWGGVVAHAASPTSAPQGARLDEGRSEKRAVVIGAGVAGLCSAKALHDRGYEVVVMDTNDGPGQACTAAAAGGCQRMNVRVSKAMWKSTVGDVVKGLFTSSKELTPTRVRAHALLDPHFYRYMAAFSHASLMQDEQTRNDIDQQMLAFTSWAINLLQRSMEEDGGRLANASTADSGGGLKLVRSEEQLARLHENPHWSGDSDHEPSRVLSREELLAIAPWVARSRDGGAVVGALMQVSALRANSEWYAAALAEQLRERGVRFEYGVRVTALEVGTDEAASDAGKRVTGLRTASGVRPVERDTSVVVACGAWSTLLMRTAGYWLPQYPLKGYNLLVDVGESDAMPDGTPLPRHIVADGPLYIARYGSQLRIASIGEFDGWNTEVREEVADAMRRRAITALPGLEHEINEARVVVGLRPFVADTRVMVGAVPGLCNAYLNTGPGFNGWKVAVGAGELLAMSVNGESTTSLGFDATPMAPQGRLVYSPRFSRICSWMGLS